MKQASRFSVFLIAAYSVYCFFSAPAARAESSSISYSNPNLVLDSDLDGLTNEGEAQKFGTDPAKSDSDGDGWFDGAEIINHTNPLDPSDPSVRTTVTQFIKLPPAPWAWYITRGSGLIAFTFAWLVIFLGVAVRFPVLNRIFSPAYSLSVHHSLAFQVIFFSLLHGISFLFDTHFNPSVADAFIPFWIKSMNPLPLALGILGFYGMVILTVTSWIKPMIPQRVWRAIHFLNILVYGSVIAHALLLGTDLKIPAFRNIFIGANIFLVALLFGNIFLKIVGTIRRLKPANDQGIEQKPL